METRLYDHLFGATAADIPEGGTFMDGITPDSLRTVTAMAEPAVAEVTAGDRVQFERLGYFRADEDSAPGKPVFNRTATLKDSWARETKK